MEIVSKINLKLILTKFSERILDLVKEMIPAVKTGSNSGNLEINNDTEIALGNYNKSSEDTLLSVGNGVDEENRSNAFEVKSNGDVYITNKSKSVILQELLAEPIPVSDVDELN
jgi:hypothetical protein